MVECGRRERLDRVPARVRRDGGIDAGADEAEVRRGHEPGARIGAGLELLEVGELAHVDLLREVPPDRALERLLLEPAAGKRPAAACRGEGPAPEERLQLPLPDLQHNRRRSAGRGWYPAAEVFAS